MISNVTIAGSMAADGVTTSLKPVSTLTLFVATAYSASEGRNTPPSSVDDGANVRLDAPSTDTSSREPVEPLERTFRSPSTS